MPYTSPVFDLAKKRLGKEAVLPVWYIAFRRNGKRWRFLIWLRYVVRIWFFFIPEFFLGWLVRKRVAAYVEEAAQEGIDVPPSKVPKKGRDRVMVKLPFTENC